MAFCLPAKPAGTSCMVDLARGCSLLTSWQVQYVVETFDLQDAERTFDFVFRLYNFVSLANEDNKTLQKPRINVVKLYSNVENMGLSSLTAAQRRRRPDDGEGGPLESDILSDVAILDVLERAGYTIRKEVEGFE